MELLLKLCTHTAFLQVDSGKQNCAPRPLYHFWLHTPASFLDSDQVWPSYLAGFPTKCL